MYKLLIAAGVLSLSGCAITNQTIFDASAGTTGCHPNEMKMIERKGNGFTGMKYWILECNDQKFSCTVATNSAGICREMKKGSKQARMIYSDDGSQAANAASQAANAASNHIMHHTPPPPPAPMPMF